MLKTKMPGLELDDKTRHAASHDSQNTATVDELGRSSHYCMFDVRITVINNLIHIDS